ncbi:MAG TPA: YdaS family helix-turn-helix protein [Burkholderiales bacterium]|nr:YdaS family helix-turn-helix protein [Burkholderiales bacterium]
MTLTDYVKAVRGRGVELARELEIDPELVSQWTTGVRDVPLDRCVAIEQATEGAVSCEELRPDKAAYFAYLTNRLPRKPRRAA